jgi:hypothetical protein
MLGGSVSIIGFPEEMAPELLRLTRRGARILDLEHDLGAFNSHLPRLHSTCLLWVQTMAAVPVD